MRIHLLVIAAALSLAAGCERGNETAPPSATPPSSGGTASGGATTPTTPANIGQPSSQEERKDGTNPVQGQVDPKEREQRQDFKQPGDAAGPTSPDTKPKTGG